MAIGTNWQDIWQDVWQSIWQSASDTSVTPDVGTITFTGYAPTLAQTANQSVTPGVGSVVVTGYIPDVAQSAGNSVTPSVGTITFTGYAPTLSQSVTNDLTPGVGSVTITGYAPSVTSIPDTTAAFITALMSYEVTTGVTFQDLLTILLAVAAGKTNITNTGGGTATVVFRDVQDTKDVVSAEMSGSERINITLDP